jgi:hypothetical protein
MLLPPRQLQGGLREPACSSPRSDMPFGFAISGDGLASSPDG